MLHFSSRNTLFGGMLVALLGLSSAAQAQVLPLTPLSAVKANDANGLPLLNNQTVRVRGVIYGENSRPTGYQINIIDMTGGTVLFRNTGTPNYVAVEGDSVEAVGKIAPFNGLTEIADVSATQPLTITFLGRGRLRPARPLSGPLTEAEEGLLVRLTQNVQLVNPAQWNPTGAAFTADVRTAGANPITYSMRVPAGSDFAGAPAPSGFFQLTGLVGQFDNSSPYTSGYQIFPRRLADIGAALSAKEAAFGRMLELYPNPAANVLRIAGLNGQKNVSYEVVSQLGQRVLGGKLEGSAIVTEQLSAGVYVLRITTAEGTASRRFAKQ